MQKSRALFVVAHPDDEVIWCGGFISELSKFEFMDCYVICLAGASPNSPRKKEFLEAKAVAGYKNGVVLGDRLLPALQRLPDISESVSEGLKELGLKPSDISLVISHSPYGDEQKNPHHIQAYQQVKGWASRESIPFGYFSCVPVPFVSHRSLLQKPLRNGTFYVTNLSKCVPAVPFWRRLLDPLFRERFQAPKYYVQFFSGSDSKKKMLDCYHSIDVEMHRRNYISATSEVEGLYLFCERGIAVFARVFENMEIKENPKFFENVNFLFRFREVFGGR